MSSPGREGVDQRPLLRDVGEDAQLDLAVVGDQQHVPGRGDEGAADALAQLGADGDVLQVGIGRGEPAGGRHRLVEAGVDAAVGADELRQGVDVGRLELGQLAVAQQELGDRIAPPASSSRVSAPVE